VLRAPAFTSAYLPLACQLQSSLPFSPFSCFPGSSVFRLTLRAGKSRFFVASAAFTLGARPAFSHSGSFCSPAAFCEFSPLQVMDLGRRPSCAWIPSRRPRCLFHSHCDGLQLWQRPLIGAERSLWGALPFLPTGPWHSFPFFEPLLIFVKEPEPDSLLFFVCAALPGVAPSFSPTFSNFPLWHSACGSSLTYCQ